MATHQQTTAVVTQCPECTTSITFEDGTWQCPDCGHAARHGAD
jgi:ribosomal protein L37AE/L43A